MSSGKRLLAESSNYYISGECESAYLYRKKDDSRVCLVGDHYGDPAGAVISPDEKFCVTFGCGVIVYLLREPYADYAYDVSSPSWYEFGRGPEDVSWIESVTLQGSTLILKDETGQEHIHEVKLET